MYWIVVFFLLGLLLIFNLIYYVLKRYIYPSINDYVRSLDGPKEYEIIVP